MKNFKLIIANNVFPVAYEIIKNKGYRVSKSAVGYVAHADNCEFTADDTVQLLGLINIYEAKGENWATSDHMIEEFISNLENGE